MEHLHACAHQYVPVSVIVLNLDRFKTVNLTLGIAGGDDMLRAMATRVRAVCAEAGAHAYRLAGDEFVVVVPGAVHAAVPVADRLRQQVPRAATELHLHERMVVTASAGVAPLVMPDESVTDEEYDPLAVMTAAAEALRVAKREHDATHVFSSELRDEVLH